MCAASRTSAPAASAVPTHAVTVSPAPETSNTSRAIVGMRVISPSFIVVLDQQRVRIPHRLLDRAAELLHDPRRDRLLDFFIDAQHLLPARDDAGLGRRGPAGIDDEIARIELSLFELEPHRLPAR